MAYRIKTKGVFPVQLDSKTIVMAKQGTDVERMIHDFKNRDRESRGRKFNAKTITRG